MGFFARVDVLHPVNDFACGWSRNPLWRMTASYVTDCEQRTRIFISGSCDGKASMRHSWTSVEGFGIEWVRILGIERTWASLLREFAKEQELNLGRFHEDVVCGIGMAIKIQYHMSLGMMRFNI
ncbi:hypothetical protein PanWU01x14_025090 [Parasponia andersonii]|uniref:Uncharacterized protein n=1 Tax=Parasponia andersonii TaxID=3476 RepID=A0A2P5DWT0_PARAD|nr:hypothetical protein PanWU01x14_025090 [Parasponia andersonii]